MIIHDVAQGTEAWMRLRMGKPTASQFHRIVTPTGKVSSQESDYCNELLAELIMGHPLDGVSMPWMERGKAMEQEARAFYELEKDVTLQQVGFLTTDDRLIGASPDSLCGEDGMVEIKCPSAAVHVQYLLSEKAGADRAYMPQLQGQLLVSGRAWIDIISYHPEMPPAIVRVPRDEEFIKMLSTQLRHFLMLLDERQTKLEQRGWIATPKPEETFDWLGMTETDIERICGERTAGVVK